MKEKSEMIRANGDIMYFDSNHQYHNELGPAYIAKNGYMTYDIHGKLHREDGPAKIYADGEKIWWIDHKRIS